MMASGVHRDWLRPESDVAQGGWLGDGDESTNLYAKLNEASPDDGSGYIKYTSGAQGIYKAAFPSPVATPTAATFRVRVRQESGVLTGDGNLEIRESGTVRAQIAFDDTTDAWTTYSTTITGVSNWANVEFWVYADSNVGGGGGPTYAWVTWVEIDYLY